MVAIAGKAIDVCPTLTDKQYAVITRGDTADESDGHAFLKQKNKPTAFFREEFASSIFNKLRTNRFIQNHESELPHFCGGVKT